MNNYELHFFGCSFTALETSHTGYKFKNYRNLIVESLKPASFVNHSFQGKSNHEIVNDIYLTSQQSGGNYQPFYIIQTTFLERLGLPCDIENKFVSLCKTENADDYYDKIHIDFYKNYLKYYYSRKNGIDEFIKMFDMIGYMLKFKKIPFIMIGIDESLDNIDNTFFFKRNNFLKFDDKSSKSFYNFAVLNKLRIYDILENDSKLEQHKDFHFNQAGHDLLTEKILDKINNQND